MFSCTEDVRLMAHGTPSIVLLPAGIAALTSVFIGKEPMRSVLARLEHAATPRERGPVDLGVDRRGLHLDKDDAEEFLRMMERDFAYLSDRYYLSLGMEPRLRVSGRRITVTFEVDSED